jgi:hypothetical protein
MDTQTMEKELPTLVDNLGNFPTVEKETPTSLTKPLHSDILAIQYPKVGDLIYFAGQHFVVTKELNRKRFIIKWRKEA